MFKFAQIFDVIKQCFLTLLITEKGKESRCALSAV